MIIQIFKYAKGTVGDRMSFNDCPGYSEETRKLCLKKRAYPLWSGCYGIFPAFLNTYPAQIPDIYRCIPFNSDRLSFLGDLQITIGTV